MTKAVFSHKPNSGYDDQPDRFYHFPKIYLSRVDQVNNDRIIYYGSLPGKNGRYYFATAKVVRIRQDTKRSDHYYADVEEYLDFEPVVNYLASGGYERKLVAKDGKINGGTAQSAVRLIDEETFARICEAGLPNLEPWPDRKEFPESQSVNSPGFAEDSPIFMHRELVSQLVNKPFRDARFRQNVLNAYDRRCAFTGLRLINGGGRPEVEAAHIVPVTENGTDAVCNGLALSGTVHWMFDRGLLSLADDLTILQSRKLNHDITHILNKDMKALCPSDHRLRPHTRCLNWHREKFGFQT